MQAPVNVICMKWGTLYGPDYVNFLRVYANVLLLLVISLVCPLWPRAGRAVLAAWLAISVAFVTAYSRGLI